MQLRQKLAYMALGGVLVLAGMVFAAQVLAQEPPTSAKTLRVESLDPQTTQSLIHGALGETVGTRWALLVGINQYARLTSGGFTISPLRVAVRDVQAVAQSLSDGQRGNFPPDQVAVLTNQQATKRNILLSLNNIVRKAGPKDLVFFYFSGHGYYDKARGITYFLPHDAEMEDPSTTCIDLIDLRKKFDELKANKLVTVLDACHSGGIKDQGAKAVEQSPYNSYLKAFEQAEGRPMLLSSDESEVSWEMPSGENSVFTHFLLKALEGEADYDHDGVIGFGEVARYVEQEVPQFTRANGLAAQRPTRRDTGGQIRGEIPLAIDLNTLLGIHQTLDAYVERLKRLQSLVGRGPDRLLKHEADQIAQYAARVKEDEVRKRTLPSEARQMLPLVEQLIEGSLTVKDFLAERDRLYPLGLPYTEGIALSGKATLRVQTTPMGASIYVDGKFVGYTPREIRELPIGRHRIRLTLSGKQDYEESILLEEGKTTRLLHKW